MDKYAARAHHFTKFPAQSLAGELNQSESPIERVASSLVTQGSVTYFSGVFEFL